jgi:hypothetical protein
MACPSVGGPDAHLVGHCCGIGDRIFFRPKGHPSFVRPNDLGRSGDEWGFSLIWRASHSHRGLVWEFFLGLLIYKLFNIGTFNPGTWVATLFMAVVINTFIERAALRRFFKQPVAGRRAFWLLFLANFLSVGLAFASLFVFMPERG